MKMTIGMSRAGWLTLHGLLLTVWQRYATVRIETRTLMGSYDYPKRTVHSIRQARYSGRFRPLDGQVA
jgi:hypothetical protein